MIGFHVSFSLFNLVMCEDFAAISSLLNVIFAPIHCVLRFRVSLLLCNTCMVLCGDFAAISSLLHVIVAPIYCVLGFRVSLSLCTLVL